MIISILTLFPEFFPPLFEQSILGRAQKKGLLRVQYINIRDFATDSHKTVDDTPFGGGVGMILRIDVVHKALLHTIKTVSQDEKSIQQRIIFLDPGGSTYTQKKARELAMTEHLILICGHYEGIDARIDAYIDERISIGSYILTGGEIPAMVIADSVARLVPGVLPDEAISDESFSDGNMLESPHFTRPSEYDEKKVPETLLSGDHKAIKEWRKLQAIKRTKDLVE